VNILVVEDRAAVSCYLTEALELEGHMVLAAYNISDAKDHWARRRTMPIHCIIVDLNMPTDGLDQKQEGESHGGLLTGWLWLHDCVLPHVPAKYRQRVIICSGFLADLEKLVRADKYQGIFLVDKHSPSSGAAKVLERVSAISRLAD